ncbi:MAG: 30S ribosomal protein S17 [Patescibacteria group bacterium]
METQKKTVQRRHLSGIVVSTKMAKTIVVRLDRRIPHPKYGKYFTVSTRLKVHDEKGVAKRGDLVEIEETRPLSKDKCWRLISVVKTTE